MHNISIDGLKRENLVTNLRDLDFIIVQTDGDKKIELKPGFYMEHDKDV